MSSIVRYAVVVMLVYLQSILQVVLERVAEVVRRDNGRIFPSPKGRHLHRTEQRRVVRR